MSASNETDPAKQADVGVAIIYILRVSDNDKVETKRVAMPIGLAPTNYTTSSALKEVMALQWNMGYKCESVKLQEIYYHPLSCHQIKYITKNYGSWYIRDEDWRILSDGKCNTFKLLE